MCGRCSSSPTPPECARATLLAITWEHVDFESRMITLEQGTTKNQDAPTVPIVPGDMLDLLTSARAAAPEATYVFNNAGVPIRDFRGAWEKATKAAGVPELTFHDL